MDFVSTIKRPIESELNTFIELFNQSLMHSDGLLGRALEHIRQRAGKRMRPMLILLMAKNFGEVSEMTQNAAIGLELLHTASLVHDDVVDESAERRGQASVNATYDNKVAVLVGDYILSTALLHVARTHSEKLLLIWLSWAVHCRMARYCSSQISGVATSLNRCIMMLSSRKQRRCLKLAVALGRCRLAPAKRILNVRNSLDKTWA